MSADSDRKCNTEIFTSNLSTNANMYVWTAIQNSWMHNDIFITATIATGKQLTVCIELLLYFILQIITIKWIILNSYTSVVTVWLLSFLVAAADNWNGQPSTIIIPTHSNLCTSSNSKAMNWRPCVTALRAWDPLPTKTKFMRSLTPKFKRHLKTFSFHYDYGMHHQADCRRHTTNAAVMSMISFYVDCRCSISKSVI